MPVQPNQLDPIAPVSSPDRSAATRVIFLAMGLVAAIATAYFLHLGEHAHQWMKNPELLRTQVQSLGYWLYPVSIAAGAAMVSCGIPRLLLAGVAGALFGFWRGLLIAECATVLGYYGVFMFVRWGGQQWVLHRWPRLRKWADHLKGQGIVGVILLRQMPIHGTLTNLALGLSGMKPAVFVIGTAIGLFPEGIPAVMVGSSLLQGSAKKIATMLGGAVVVFVVLFVVAGYFVRSRKNQSTATALLNEQLTINEPPEN